MQPERMNTAKQGKRSRRSQAVLVGLGCAGAILLGIAFRQNILQYRQDERKPDTVQVRTESLDLAIIANGTVTAVQTVKISPARAGRLQNLVVNEGQRVDEGQLLAVMENEEERSRLSEAKAELKGAKADENAEQKRLKRYKELLRNGAISEDDVDEQSRKLTSAQARVEQTRAKLQEFQAIYDKTFIRAPFSGIITRRFAELSEYVAPDTSASSTAGATSSSIAELSRGLEVEAKVPEAELLNVKVGQQATISSEAFPGRKFAGVIARISPRAVVTENVITFPVVVDLLSGFRQLKPQMNVVVKIQVDQPGRSLVLPLAAISTRKDGRNTVVVLESDGSLNERLVRLGSSLGTKVQIIEGVSAGEKVLISSIKSGVKRIP